MLADIFLFLTTLIALIITYILGYRRGVKHTISHYESICKDWEDYCEELQANWKKYCEELATEYKKFINDACEYDYFQLNTEEDGDIDEDDELN